MKRLQSVLFVAVAAILLAAPAKAASIISIDYCPGDASCPAGVKANLSFEDYVNPADLNDVNDYKVTITISGDSSAPYYVDEVSFKIDSAQIGDYESLPTLISAPGQGAPWVVYFDNISGSANSCVANTGQQQAVCSQSGPGNLTNYGAPLQGTTANPLQWTFLVDLKDSEGPLSATSAVNLRAQFLDQNGKNVGILSPVPEPGTLALLGVGASLAAIRRRRAQR